MANQSSVLKTWFDQGRNRTRNIRTRKAQVIVRENKAVNQVK